MEIVAEGTTSRHGSEITGNPNYEGSPFIDFSSVDSSTNLEQLNLNWGERDLPEKQRTKHIHRLHPYLGKFVPQLVEIFLRKYFAPGQTVLDPFCGSGTTLVQANELGINSIGFDVSAFNVLLTTTKTAKYNLVNLEREVHDALQAARLATANGSVQLSLTDIGAMPLDFVDDVSNEYLATWYAPRARTQLLAYRHAIESREYEYSGVLNVILSRAARSSRLTTHYELDFPRRPQTEPYECHKHDRLCAPTEEALKFLERYSLDTIRRIREFSSIRTDALVQVFHVDSRNVPIPPIDGVLTSPPYVGLIDYHEQHAYGYHLLGLTDNRQAEIGPAARGSSQKAKVEYKRDIAEVFRRAADSMSSGGRLIVVAGDRHGLYPEIAEMAGVETEAVIERHVNRRTGRRSTPFYESVFVWRKC